MILHYLKLALRSLTKYKYYTLINVFGLVCGMLSALIIAKYIGGSLQFDSFHEKKERIYAVSQEEFIDGISQGNRKSTYLGVASLLPQFEGISLFSTYYQRVESLVIADGNSTGERKAFTENKIFVADSTFFKIFSFPFVFGNESSAFSTPNSVVITRSTANRYFGDVNPVGETLTMRVSWGAESTYQISGVIEDIPKLSRFDFDFLIRQSSLNEAVFWDTPAYAVFMLLAENVEPDRAVQNLNNAVSQIPNMKSGNKRLAITLDSLASPQLSTAEYLLMTVGIFIILISWVNYINQIIAQSYWRMKEAGILRTMGASRGNLRGQFVLESALMCLTCLMLVFGIYLGLEQPLLNLTSGHLLPLIGDPTFVNVAFIGVFAAGVIMAATIQTLILLPANFGASIRSVHTTKMGSIVLRKMLVVVQFSISTILIVAIFVISEQLEFMRTSEKGISMDNILVIKTPMAKDTTWNVKRKTLELFKKRCAALPFVMGVTSSTTVPSEAYRHETYLRLQDGNTKSLIHQIGIDEHFFSLYEVKFIAGQDFIPHASAKNRSSIILNRSAARALGISDFDSMINAKIVAREEGEEEEVFDLVGIVEDFHQTSLRDEVRPIAFKYNVLRGHCSFKVNMMALTGAGLSNGLGAIQEIWNESYPESSFEYFFLDAQFNAQDREDEYFGILFRYFTILSVIISCMGLFALSLLISTKRQKEVGVRKVFGASPTDILSMFLKSYLIPLLISLLIGVPVAISLMDAWLSNYAYRIHIGFGLVSLAVGSLVLIFVFTVSYYTVKSSATNPIKVLRE